MEETLYQITWEENNKGKITLRKVNFEDINMFLDCLNELQALGLNLKTNIPKL